MTDKPVLHLTPTVITARANGKCSHILMVPPRSGRRPVRPLDAEGVLSWVCADGRQEVLDLPEQVRQEVSLQRKTTGVLVYDEDDAQGDLMERLPVALFAR